MNIELIRASIRAVPDFPTDGIIFRDIAPLLANPEAFEAVMQCFEERFKGKAEAIAGIDSRGFVFGAPLASRLGLPFIMVRKPGKLPGKVMCESYSLEYGANKLEVQVDAVKPGTKVLLVDDLLATGGSSNAAIRLLKRIGADVVGAAFVIELAFLNGIKEFDVDTYSIIRY